MTGRADESAGVGFGGGCGGGREKESRMDGRSVACARLKGERAPLREQRERGDEGERARASERASERGRERERARERASERATERERERARACERARTGRLQSSLNGQEGLPRAHAQCLPRRARLLSRPQSPPGGRQRRLCRNRGLHTHLPPFYAAGK